MNKQERFAALKAMDRIARSLSDEEIFCFWISYGVPDEEITEETAIDEVEFLLSDEIFKEIGEAFLTVMDRAAKRKSRLYIDGVSMG